MSLYHSVLKHTGLSGRDGNLSFSKAVTLLVLALKPPAALGIACVAASFGARAFGHFIETGRAPKEEPEAP